MKKNRQYSHEAQNNFFVKTYGNDELLDNDILQLEYQKGLLLNKIINYPKPIKVHGHSIYYEFIDIKYSLFEALADHSKNIDSKHMKKIGEYLRKMHDNDILHGDFGPSNVVFDQQDNIYFIDASFSPHNTDGRVLWKADNIYRDISLFLMHLSISKPLYKFWQFFCFRRNQLLRSAFLGGYFTDAKKFDMPENCRNEILFFKKHKKYIRKNKHGLTKIIRLSIANFFILARNTQAWLNKQ
jgi:serine/threonine protein kinase